MRTLEKPCCWKNFRDFLEKLLLFPKMEKRCPRRLTERDYLENTNYLIWKVHFYFQLWQCIKVARLSLPGDHWCQEKKPTELTSYVWSRVVTGMRSWSGYLFSPPRVLFRVPFQLTSPTRVELETPIQGIKLVRSSEKWIKNWGSHS